MGDDTHTSLEGELLSYAIDRYTDDGDESAESETTSSDKSEATESAESETTSSDDTPSSVFGEEHAEVMDQLPLWARLTLHISNAGFALFFGWVFLQTSMHLLFFPLALVSGMVAQTFVVYIVYTVITLIWPTLAIE